MKLILTFLLGALLGAAVFAESPTATFKQLRTLSGKEYTEVAVTGVLPNSIRFTHEAGAATVQLADLSPELQKQFGYDPAKAAEFSRRQAEADGANRDRTQMRANLAKLEGLVRGSKLNVQLRIMQVLENGVLAHSSEVGAHDAVGRVFLVCDTYGKVDGGEVQGSIYFAGTHSYTTVAGARATVMKYATSAEKAVALLVTDFAGDDAIERIQSLMKRK
jgi:hypothetical protein